MLFYRKLKPSFSLIERRLSEYWEDGSLVLDAKYLEEAQPLNFEECKRMFLELETSMVRFFYEGDKGPEQQYSNI